VNDSTLNISLTKENFFLCCCCLGMLCIHRHSQEFISIRVKYSVDDLCSLKVICCTINDGFDLVVNGV